MNWPDCSHRLNLVVLFCLLDGLARGSARSLQGLFLVIVGGMQSSLQLQIDVKVHMFSLSSTCICTGGKEISVFV